MIRVLGAGAGARAGDCPDRADGPLFVLDTPSSSYILGLFRGLPVHVWWGERMEMPADAMRDIDACPPTYSVAEDPADKSWSAARLRLEYPGGLAGDLRRPAFSAVSAEAGPVFAPRCVSWRVYAGKPAPEGMPSSRGGAGEGTETLELELLDGPSGLRLLLSWTVFPGTDVIARNVSLANGGSSAILLGRCASFSLDPALRGPVELVALEGSWARERMISRELVSPGRREIGSLSGASGHRFSPCAALVRPWTTELSGEAWGAALVYSGSWAMSVEADEAGGYRWQGGIQAEGFAWSLGPGGRFDCPEALLCHSGSGLSGMSASWHDFLRDRVSPPAWKDRERPVLFNSWEGTYFDFDEERILAIAGRAAALGAELFVLDDGWFGRRDGDNSSLGDWYADPRKLPGGLPRLADGVRGLGLGFGIWVEPEMVSPDSDLHRERPDWCLHLPGRPRAEGRNQLVLDLSRPEVRAEIARRMISLIASCGAAYVKWDLNRHLGLALTAALDPSRQGEARHRWLLGSYELAREVTAAFPDVLFEGCAGGGGRMDFGLLAYTAQYWTSDGTDALSRIGVQYGTSLFFPPVAMGAHVSASPNHQTGRNLSMASRAAVAFGGNLGYELDPTVLSAADAEAVSRDIAWYKERRALVQAGRFIRLASPWDQGRTGVADSAWICVARDRSRALLTWIRPLAVTDSGTAILRLAGLESARRYRLAERPAEECGGAGASRLAGAARAGERRAWGSELMTRGLEIEPGRGDCSALLLDIIAD